MLQNTCKILGFKKNMVYKFTPEGGDEPYPASGLHVLHVDFLVNYKIEFDSTC